MSFSRGLLCTAVALSLCVPVVGAADASDEVSTTVESVAPDNLKEGLTGPTNWQFDVDGITYVVTEGENHAEVKGPVKPKSTAALTIKSKVEFQGKTYPVTRIYNCGFMGAKLSSIKFPSTLKEIGAGAFNGCTNLLKDGTLKLPASVTKVDLEAFDKCRFKKVVIQENVKEIGNGAFADNPNLTTLSFPQEMANKMKIGVAAFAECPKLTSVKLPYNTTSIGQQAFRNCTALATVEIPSTVKIIGGYSFMDCKALKSLTIPRGVTTIEQCAFANSGLQSISLPPTLTTIYAQAFGASALTYVIIPSSVTVISEECFAHCQSLKTVVLPATTTEIYPRAFYDCPALSEIQCDAVNPPTINNASAFSDFTYEKARLILPAASLNAYINAPVWKNFRWLKNAGIDDIAANAEESPAYRYFNLSGMEVSEENLTTGLYIRTWKGKSEKIAIQ